MPRDTRPTPATRFLDAAGVTYTLHHYDYIDHGGAKRAAECLGVDEAAVVKTLVMRADSGGRMLVLMHGDRQVSQKQLARVIGARKILSCSPDEALKVTGYQVGGISPFGTRTELPIYAEASIRELPRIYVNGGRRGLLLEIGPEVLEATLAPEFVSVATG